MLIEQSPRVILSMHSLFPNLYGLLLIATGCFWGNAMGSWLFGSVGGLFGLALGAFCALSVAERLILILKELQDSGTDRGVQSNLALASESGKTTLGRSKRPWFSRVFKQRPERRRPPEPDGSYNLEEIHGYLKTINASLWKQLRSGVLCSCFLGIYEVQLNETEEGLDWREVNRRTVSAFRRFEIATTDEERVLNLKEALYLIGQKHLLVHKAALRKADSLNPEEERVIRQNESELWRLSHMLRLPPS
jgi:hypothetical protein